MVNVDLYSAIITKVDGPAAAQLAEDSDDVLFACFAHHVLHGLLPHPNTHDYELRPRRRNLSRVIRHCR